MKIRLVVVSLAVGLSLIFLTGVGAQTLMSERIGVGARASYLLPRLDKALDSNFAMEGVFSYGVAPTFTTEVSVGHTRPAVLTEAGGKAQLTYILLSFQLRGEPTTDFAIYLGAGPGVILNKWSARGSERDMGGRDTFAGHLNIGFDYFITDNLALNMDAKYLWFDYRFIDRETNITGKELADSFLMGAGLKYVF